MTIKAEAANAGTFAASYKSPIINRQDTYKNNYKSEATLETRKRGKIIKLFRCFGCDGCFSVVLMSGCLMICKKCLIFERSESERQRKLFIEKTINKIGIFLRRRV